MTYDAKYGTLEIDGKQVVYAMLLDIAGVRAVMRVLKFSDRTEALSSEVLQDDYNEVLKLIASTINADGGQKPMVITDRLTIDDLLAALSWAAADTDYDYAADFQNGQSTIRITGLQGIISARASFEYESMVLTLRVVKE